MPAPPTPDALLREQPFAPAFRIARVERVGAFAHSGTACFVVDAEGRRRKLRLCRTAARAREIETLVAALGDLCPAVEARRGALLLCEALVDHRPLTREELLERVDRLGEMVARAHAAAEAHGLPGALWRRRAALRSRFQRARDLWRVRASGALAPEALLALRGKLSEYGRRFGLPIALELDDLHKANLMLRESDGDLRYVDEEGVAVRPLGTSLASLVKTADRQEHWDAFRAGYARVRDPGWITPAYTEYVVLLDTLRKVANKLRASGQLGAERLEKLPAEIEDLERVAVRSEPRLDWQFHRG